MNPSAFVLGWRVLLIPVTAVLPSLSRHFGESSPTFGFLSKRGVLWSLFQSQYLLGGNATKAMGGMGGKHQQFWLTLLIFAPDSEKRRRVGSMERHSSSGHRPQLQRHAVDIPESRCHH